MGRKSKRNSSRIQTVDLQGKHEIAKVLDNRRTSHRRINFKKTIKSESYLKEKFEPLFEKFRVPEDLSSRQVTTYYNKEKPIEMSEILEEVGEPLDNQHLSKKQIRQASKPSLYELKESVAYPQTIDWYDCDAQYPHLQAYIKSSKNIVEIPANWQNKKEYLSGRSLLDKKPFELPEIIKGTNIEQLRQVIPDETTKESTLRETARTRVQPKIGTLDIDYKKVYDVFFKFGSNWKPDLLLPFGDLYYEGRNLNDEAKWRKLVKEKKAGQLSTELRSVMGLGEGQLPPWCMKMKNSGMPPSYPNLKIAGLNWGIENLKGTVYGTLSTQRGNEDKLEYFGEVIALNDEQEGEKSEEQESPQKYDRHGTERHKYINTDIIQESENSEVQKNIKEPEEVSWPLYTVIEEKKSDIATFTTGSRTIYTISNERDIPKRLSNSSEDSDHENKQDCIEKFKF